MKGMEILKVRLRGGFSDRNKINCENTNMQYKTLDDRTRAMLANITTGIFNKKFGRYSEGNPEPQGFIKMVYMNVYLQEIQWDRTIYYEDFYETIKSTILHDDYDNVFSLIEYLADAYDEFGANEVYEIYNSVFKQEFVGYRFIDRIIVPITDENELESMEQALCAPYVKVTSHLEKALILLSDRDKPDYENSIKESISAVEAMCVILLGKGASLGAALKQLEKNGVVIHPSMKSAFEKLYGYTSDANGIRHAGNIGGSSSTFEEAKFMLVSCSAFINYLIGVSVD